jgi:hypothetical protein
MMPLSEMSLSDWIFYLLLFQVFVWLGSRLI